MYQGLNAIFVFLFLFVTSGCEKNDRDPKTNSPRPMDETTSSVESEVPGSSAAKEQEEPQDTQITTEALRNESILGDAKHPAFALDRMLQADLASWMQWRGDAQNNVFYATKSNTGPEIEMSVAWEKELLGEGHSSPVICGGKIFLSSAVEKDETQLMLALNAESGETLWHTEVHQKNSPNVHNKNSHATSTPVCDHHFVYVAFQNGDGIWLTAIAPDGMIIWQKMAGYFPKAQEFAGFASSLAMYRGAIIVLADVPELGFMAAVSKDDGAILWRNLRGSKGNASHSSPVILKHAGEDQILTAGAPTLAGYDAKTGAELWRFSDESQNSVATPTVSNGIVYFSSSSSSDPHFWFAVSLPQGAVAAAQVWKQRAIYAVGSPLVLDGRLYFIDGSGILKVLDAGNGKTLHKARLPGAFSSSPIAAFGRIFVVSEEGTVFVIDPSHLKNKPQTLDLGDAVFASPVVVGEYLYIRSEKKLFKIKVLN